MNLSSALSTNVIERSNEAIYLRSDRKKTRHGLFNPLGEYYQTNLQTNMDSNDLEDINIVLNEHATMTNVLLQYAASLGRRIENVREFDCKSKWLDRKFY